jgi:hypothetical protein
VANVRGERSRRKFLFLLKYRGSTFHQRFYHDNAECLPGRRLGVVAGIHVREGFKQPTDVWFYNLRTILELRMDPEGEWIKDLPKRMWFTIHAQRMYLTICTPSNPAMSSSSLITAITSSKDRVAL